MKTLSILLVFAIMCMTSACKTERGRVEEKGSAKAAVPLAPADIAETISELPGSKSMEGVAVVLGKIANEKKARPAVKVTVENVHSQLSKDGVALLNVTQVFAGLVGASYCVNGTTQDGVVVAVCEFRDEKQAKDGEALIAKNYAKFTPDAVRKMIGSTLVTVVNGTVAKATQSQVIKSISSL